MLVLAGSLASRKSAPKRSVQPFFAQLFGVHKNTETDRQTQTTLLRLQHPRYGCDVT